MSIVVVKASMIPVGRFEPVAVDCKGLLVCHTKEGFYANDNACTHDESSLRCGWLNGPMIGCPLHGARFDVRTGAVVRAPVEMPIQAYPVAVEEEDAIVDLRETLHGDAL